MKLLKRTIVIATQLILPRTKKLLIFEHHIYFAIVPAVVTRVHFIFQFASFYTWLTVNCAQRLLQKQTICWQMLLTESLHCLSQCRSNSRFAWRSKRVSLNSLILLNLKYSSKNWFLEDFETSFNFVSYGGGARAATAPSFSCV